MAIKMSRNAEKPTEQKSVTEILEDKLKLKDLEIQALNNKVDSLSEVMDELILGGMI